MQSTLSDITQNGEYYIGLMSGTSLDGIDGVLTQFMDQRIEILRYSSIRYPDNLRHQFTALNSPADNEIQRIQSAARQRCDLAIGLIDQLCAGFDRKQIIAVADHGQTVRHFPNADPAYTLQIHQGARLAELSGLDCVVDFRSKDIAAGGQGAPLVPAFHQAFFSNPLNYRAIINIGGIANISLLRPKSDSVALGFDTGPGNTLLDTWCEQHTGQAFDQDGHWAASGIIDNALLAQFLEDPYFSAPPPKSTGREHFNAAWLEQQLARHKTSGPAAELTPENVQATLLALTVESINLGLQQAGLTANMPTETAIDGLYICGGGAHNSYLMRQLAKHSAAPVYQSEMLGIPPQQVEAAAFSWLGKQAIAQQAIDLCQTTGARHRNILGAIYRA